jgi:pimeloyl-ACP methyl ester carboxylesterase
MIQASHVRLPDGRQLGYQEYGAFEGDPVFFFHGWIGSRLDFGPNDAAAKALGIRVVSVDRPGCGSSDFQPDRKMLDWPNDVSSLADALGIWRFAVCGHSFGGPYVAACAHQLSSRVTSAAIVAGISPVSVSGATRGMPALVRGTFWLGGRVPVLTRPFVTLMAASVKRPKALRKGMRSRLPEGELALLDEPRFAGFVESLGEMVARGSKGAYWDARVFLGDWGFGCADIEVPVFLFYGRADHNVPVHMGEYYRDSIPGSRATFYPDEGHLIMYSRASEILSSLLGEGG